MAHTFKNNFFMSMDKTRQRFDAHKERKRPKKESGKGQKLDSTELRSLYISSLPFMYKLN